MFHCHHNWFLHLIGNHHSYNLLHFLLPTCNYPKLDFFFKCHEFPIWISWTSTRDVNKQILLRGGTCKKLKPHRPYLNIPPSIQVRSFPNHQNRWRIQCTQLQTHYRLCKNKSFQTTRTETTWKTLTYCRWFLRGCLDWKSFSTFIF